MAYQGEGSKENFQTLHRHQEYYINGGDLYFLVEKVYFRVHRFFFERDSPRFKGQLTIPASPGVPRQGNSESNAIFLDGVTPENFSKFLWVFYNPKYSLYNTSVEDWIIILEIAHKYQFHEVKNLCVRELEKQEMPDVDRVASYNQFEVDKNLLVPRYAALCERDTPLSLQEGLQLGMEVTITIAKAREHARSNPLPTGARSPRAAHLEGSEMHILVRELFKILPADDAEDAPSPSSDFIGTTTTVTPAAGSAGSSTPTQPQGLGKQGQKQGQTPQSKVTGSEQGREHGKVQGSQSTQSQEQSKAKTRATDETKGPLPPDKPKITALTTSLSGNTNTSTNGPDSNKNSSAGSAPVGSRLRVDSNANKVGNEVKPNGNASGPGPNSGAGRGSLAKADEKTNQENSNPFQSPRGALDSETSSISSLSTQSESPTGQGRGSPSSGWSFRGRKK